MNTTLDGKLRALNAMNETLKTIISSRDAKDEIPYTFNECLKSTLESIDIVQKSIADHSDGVTQVL